MNQAKHPSKERVERDGYLVYAEGDDIPETDTAELERQGYLTKKGAPTEAQPSKRATKKAQARKRTS